MWNYALKNCVCYNDRLSKSIDNYQRLFGINCEVFRLDDRSNDNTVIAYGGWHAVKNRFSSKIKDVHLLVNPSDLYQAYSVATGNSEIEVYTSDSKLLVGDIIKYDWIDGTVLEFEVMEPPRTYGKIYFQYKLKSMYQVDAKGKSD